MMGDILEDIDRASKWVARALIRSEYLADFSLDSLVELDRFFDEHSEGGKAVPGGLLSENLGWRLFALGAYVGEVLRRAYRASWVGDDEDPEVEINVSLHFRSGGKCWPMQRVIKRFRNGAEDGLYAYAQALKGYVKPR